jgi:2-oxoglutarate dehydrogenase E1 component
MESKDAFTTPSNLRLKPENLSSQSVKPASDSVPIASDSLAISYLIRAYQVRGHEIANLDPLGIHSFRKEFPAELDYKYHGFTDDDLDRPLNLLGKSSSGNVGFLEILGKRPHNTTLRQVITSLQTTYCGTLGVEYMHIGAKDKCNWYALLCPPDSVP